MPDQIANPAGGRARSGAVAFGITGRPDQRDDDGGAREDDGGPGRGDRPTNRLASVAAERQLVPVARDDEERVVDGDGSHADAHAEECHDQREPGRHERAQRDDEDDHSIKDLVAQGEVVGGMA